MSVPDGDGAAVDVPGLTVCSLCAGETLGAADTVPGGQRGRLERLAASGIARLTFVECLDECDRGDVVVVRPTVRCRRAGVGPVWFARLAGESATGALQAWLRTGGPDGAAPPGPLDALVVDRSAPRPPEVPDAG